jgi:hypothetical protein
MTHVRSLRRSPVRLASLYSRDFGLKRPGVENPRPGVFGVRGFASHPLGSRRLGLGRD